MMEWIRRVVFRYRARKVARLLRKFEAKVLEPGADVQLLVGKIRKDILSSPRFTEEEEEVSHWLKRFMCRAFYPGRVQGLSGVRAEVTIFSNMVEAPDAQKALNRFCHDLLAAGGPDWLIQDDFNVEIREVKP